MYTSHFPLLIDIVFKELSRLLTSTGQSFQFDNKASYPMFVKCHTSVCLKSGGKWGTLLVTTKHKQGCLFQRPGPGVHLQILVRQRITPVLKSRMDHKTIESCTWNSISRCHCSEVFLPGWTISSTCSHSVPKQRVHPTPARQGISPRCCIVKKSFPFCLFITIPHSNSSYFSFIMQDVIECDL